MSTRKKKQKEIVYANCKVCNSRFAKKTAWQECCSTACRSKKNASSLTWEGKCPNCAKHISVLLADSERIKRRKLS